MKTLQAASQHPAPGVNLPAEIEELRLRLQEAEETIAAIRSGAVDALVVEEPTGHRVYTLEGADRPYRVFVEEMQQGAATLHADGTIAWCNRQLADLLRRPHEKLVGMALHDFVSPESRAHYDNLLWQGQTRSGRGEASLIRSDGGIVPVFLTFNALPQDGGAAMGVLVTDLTTQRHHEQLTVAHAALRESEARLATELAATRQLQEISSRLIQEGDTAQLYEGILDAAKSIMQSDMASMQMLDPARGELRLLAWQGFHPDSAQFWEWVGLHSGSSCGNAMSQVQRIVVEDIDTCEFILGTPDFDHFRRSDIRAMQSTPLISRDGRMLGMISTHWRKPHRPMEGELRLLDVLARQAADLLERKKAEMALRSAQIQLQEHARELEMRVAERTADLRATNEQLEAFVYSIAHDLRAPLRSMEGFSSFLLEETRASLSETARDYATRIHRSAQFLDALLQDLLSFSRVTQQRMSMAPVNLEAVVQSVCSRLEKQIEEKKARVDTTGPWPNVLAHEPTLGQVIFNLLDNALKFAVPGRPPCVRLRAEERGQVVRVWVEDDGIGIAPEHQEQVFRLFTRLHGETYGGTGIGLAIVQKGVERMGGRVGVESTAGRGSRFWFELPRA